MEETEVPKKRKPYTKRRPYELEFCPHCGVSGRGNILRRWHFDRCPHISKNKNTEEA